MKTLSQERGRLQELFNTCHALVRNRVLEPPVQPKYTDNGVVHSSHHLHVMSSCINFAYNVLLNILPMTSVFHNYQQQYDLDSIHEGILYGKEACRLMEHLIGEHHRDWYPFHFEQSVSAKHIRSCAQWSWDHAATIHELLCAVTLCLIIEDYIWRYEHEDRLKLDGAAVIEKQDN